MNDSITLIVLGASGDLAKRKILPAIYKLVEDKKLTQFALIGAAIDDRMPHTIMQEAQPFISSWDNAIAQKIESSLYYQQIDFNKPEDFMKLVQLITSAEKKHSLSGNRIVYCATSPDFFCSISEQLNKTSIIKTGDTTPYHRIVFEKPFGSDFKSAAELNACLKKFFVESQIFRVDHYLSKELVGNIVLIRFANSIFEPLWNAQFIDSIHVMLSETVGLEGRGEYYDAYGVLKDVVQNHMLQLLALVAMEAPHKLSGDSIRVEKSRVLEKVEPITGMLGQYQGYKQEKGVKPTSQTPTFAVLELRVKNERWKDVPFYFSTGKHLDKKETSICIKFRNVTCALEESSLCEPDYLTIRIAPDSGFSLQLNAKKPGELYQVTPVVLDFCHSCVFPNTPADYETMLYEIMRGDRSIAVRFDAIEYAWKIIDAFEAMDLPVYEYAQGSKGPEQALKWAQDKKIRW